jgi:2-polyprenyl-3-methyl-5-hydroxy-6-metoxy-1,4-benzoquinol methylase
MATAERATTSTRRPTNRFFADPLRDYARQHLGQPVSVLQAGCLAPTRELGIRQLTEGGFDISVTALDAADPLPQSVLRDTGAAYSDVIVGDLRTAPIPQRKYDIVYCARLIERVQHVELVLDRLVSALKPGGLTLREHQARISSAVRISCAAISLLTRRRFSARHDELLYVIRKPQYSFARVV